MENIEICKNNPENASTTKVSEHIPSGFSILAIPQDIENNHVGYRGKDCMKKFSESLREHAMEIINFKKTRIKLLTAEQLEPHENAKFCYICKGKFKGKYVKDKKYCKVRDHCHYTGEYRGVAYSIYNSK